MLVEQAFLSCDRRRSIRALQRRRARRQACQEGFECPWRKIVVPQLGESVVEARVARWLKKEGDAVAAGEPIVELETEKIDLEVGAEQAGVLVKIARQEGEDVKVGEVLGTIADGRCRAGAMPPRRRVSGGAAGPAAAGQARLRAAAAKERADADGAPASAETHDIASRTSRAAAKRAASPRRDVAGRSLPRRRPSGSACGRAGPRLRQRPAPAPAPRGRRAACWLRAPKSACACRSAG